MRFLIIAVSISALALATGAFAQATPQSPPRPKPLRNLPRRFKPASPRTRAAAPTASRGAPARAAGDPEMEVRLAAFLDELQQLGWTDGRNVRIDTRWEVSPNHAEELVALAPDVILASSSPSVAALQQITRSVPIVFANVIDPVGAGFVESLARPGGNTTGFSAFEYSLSGRWLELLKEIAPT